MEEMISSITLLVSLSLSLARARAIYMFRTMHHFLLHVHSRSAIKSDGMNLPTTWETGDQCRSTAPRVIFSCQTILYQSRIFPTG